MLRSERLVLREFRDDDFDAVHSYGADLEVVRFMNWGPNSEDETRDFIKRAQSRASADPCVGYDLAVIEVSSDRLIGGIGLYSDGPQAMLGYCFSRSAWGKGYATEAAQLILDFGFESMDIHRVWAGCDTENVASVRVLQKLGMRQEGHLKHDCQIRGEWRDTFLYAILKDEWGPQGLRADSV